MKSSTHIMKKGGIDRVHSRLLREKKVNPRKGYGRKLFPIMIYSLVTLFASVGLCDDHSKRIIMKTEEFDQFRRIILTVPYEKNIYPEISTIPDNGKFQIKIFPVDTNDYVGRRALKKHGDYPIQLNTSFPDSTTILITGQTVPFETLIGYNVIEGDMIIFDIYKTQPVESFFREKTIALQSQNQANHPGPVLLSTVNNTTNNPGILQIIRQKTVKNRVLKAVIFAGIMSLLGVTIIIITVFVIKGDGRSRRGDAERMATDKKAKAPAGTPVGGSDEARIKELMESEGISYDEAAIMVNLSGGKINVKA